MSPVEHSGLVYLMEALEAAPNKADILLEMSVRVGASARYEEALESLRGAPSPTALRRAVVRLRQAIR